MRAEEFRGHIAGEVADDETTLTKYSRDTSIFEIKPSLVTFPRNARDIGRLVRFTEGKKRSGEHVSLTTRAAGTDMTGGPLTQSIVVDVMRHMNNIKHVDAKRATVEPGVFYRDFEKETLKHGSILPSYPASREICALGGMIANNSGGEKTLKYGKTERYVEELRVILRDGNEYAFRALNGRELEEKMGLKTLEGDIYRAVVPLIKENNELIHGAKPNVSKNSAGYALWNVWDPTTDTFDLTQLFVGSQGTLGIITNITIRLVPVKKHARLAVIFLNDFSLLPKIVHAILRYKPESFESYDSYTLKFGMRFLPSLLQAMNLWDAVALGFRFLPELWMAITGGMPKMVLMAEFTGDNEEKIADTLRRVRQDMTQFPVRIRIAATERAAQKYWLLRRESFNILRRHVRNMRTAPFIDDIIVRPESLPQFLPALYKIMDKYKLIFTIAGHIGDGNFHIIPLMDFRRDDTKEIIKTLGKEVYDLVFKFRGSMTAEHNDGLIRSPYLMQMYGGKIYALFKEVKRIFDPDDIFNPEKKTDAHAAYAFRHIIKS